MPEELPPPLHRSPGWKPDPTAHNWQRWWTGSRWQNYVWPAHTGVVSRPYMPDAPRVNVSNAPGRQVPLEAVGEFAFSPAWMAAFENSLTLGVPQTRAQVSVELVPEPDNPHSRKGQAISVRYRDMVLGYIPDDLTSSIFPDVARAVSSGYVPTVHANLWAKQLPDRDGKLRVGANARLALDVKTPMLLRGRPPGQVDHLPAGGRIQVTREDEFPEGIRHLINSGETQMLVELRVDTHTLRNGKVRERVGVYFENHQIGVLSPTMTNRHKGFVSHRSANGYSTIATARIESGWDETSTQVVLNVAFPENPTDTQVRTYPNLTAQSRTRTLPPAYVPDRDWVIPTAPDRRKFPGKFWALGILTMLLLGAIPVVGAYLLIATLVGLILFRSHYRNQAPADTWMPEEGGGSWRQ